jgi:hypothetical protein
VRLRTVRDGRRFGAQEIDGLSATRLVAAPIRPLPGCRRRRLFGDDFRRLLDLRIVLFSSTSGGRGGFLMMIGSITTACIGLPPKTV